MHTGEVGAEIAPILQADDADAELCDRVDTVLRQTCSLASVSGEDGRSYGLLQLSDKADGSDFTADYEICVQELSALVGETLDALSAARRH